MLGVPSGLLKIMNRDLEVAGIAKVDERGRSLDLHALRTTFGTMLSTAGVAPRVAQAAMRHSRIDLTMNTYTDPAHVDINGAVNSLPAISATLSHQTASSPAMIGSNDFPLAPMLDPTIVHSGDFLSSSVAKTILGQFRESWRNNEKALESLKKTRAFVSEVDGARTRNLRIDSPVL